MRWVAVAMVVVVFGCSVVSMRPVQSGSVVPDCTDSILPPVADGLMFLTASAVAASHLYARRYDRSYCGPGPDGSIPIDGCGYEGEGSIGAPVALIAAASMVIGANRYSECHAAYDTAEQQRTPVPRASRAFPRVVASASFAASALFALMAATLFSRY